jgi:hypothetical protein
MRGQELSVPQGALSDEDKANVATVADSMPDIILVCGHSGGDVEDIIGEIAMSGMVPKAILATNSITGAAITRFGEMGHEAIAKGLLMPTQWGMAADMVDPNVGWTTADFISAFGNDASYHAASAAAAGIVLTEAMAMDGATTDTIANFIGSVDIDTFYGHISFNADGSPMKPMYVQQYQGENMEPVFTSMYGAMRYPLESCPGWGRLFTCGVVKEYYRSMECCGMPEKELDAYMAAQDLFTSDATNMAPMEQ